MFCVLCDLNLLNLSDLIFFFQTWHNLIKFVQQFSFSFLGHGDLTPSAAEDSASHVTPVDTKAKWIVHDIW